MKRPAKISVTDIDVNFDFTENCRYWNGFWTRKNGIGAGETDPDSTSAVLRQYHQALWSRSLPDGRYLDLDFGGASDYLRYGDIRLSSDSITTGFRYKKYGGMIESIQKQKDDYKSWMEKFIRSNYTIGGTIIFPAHPNSMNGRRGIDRRIRDRWDLTLECIRLYYDGITDSRSNPLGWVLDNDKDFFDLFADFNGYVEFFFLQDCVSDDCSAVKMWIPVRPFEDDPLPKSPDEYMRWIDASLSFVKKRNRRIADYIQTLKTDK